MICPSALFISDLGVTHSKGSNYQIISHMKRGWTLLLYDVIFVSLNPNFLIPSTEPPSPQPVATEPKLWGEICLIHPVSLVSLICFTHPLWASVYGLHYCQNLYIKQNIILNLCNYFN